VERQDPRSLDHHPPVSDARAHRGAAQGKVGADQQIGFDVGGRQIKAWTNKLIWGDNKLILSSLKSGALRRQIEDAGGLKLIYIDPPFDVGCENERHHAERGQQREDEFLTHDGLPPDFAQRPRLRDGESGSISRRTSRMAGMARAASPYVCTTTH
jgi:hypothetical protein